MTDTAERETVCPFCKGKGTYLADIGPTGRIVECFVCNGTGRAPAQEQETE